MKIQHPALATLIGLALVASPFAAQDGFVPENIAFEDLVPGTVVAEVFGDLGSGPILVEGFSTGLDGNVAVIFDSAAPSGGDDDLGTPNADFGGPGIGEGGELGSEFENNSERGHVLIIAENLIDDDGDGLIDDPDDADREGSELRFDFSAIGSVEIDRITVLDVEETENPATVEFIDDEGNSLGIVELPQVGNNGYAAVDMEPLGRVAEMIVTMNGSGAIDDVEFDAECNLQMAVSHRNARVGDRVEFDVTLTHRNPAVEVPFSFWLERADGSVIWQHTSRPFAMDYGDVIELSKSFVVPPNAKPDDYSLVVGTERMKQGIEWERRTLTIDE